VKLCFVAVLLCMVVSAPHAEAAVSCGQVATSLAPCLNYLRGSVNAPSSGCCGGVKSLYNAAQTTADRQAACKCLKSAPAEAPSISPSEPHHCTLAQSVLGLIL
ncbi:hypothetical protein E8P77_30485, partial [Soehngenia saccharolytica]